MHYVNQNQNSKATSTHEHGGEKKGPLQIFSGVHFSVRFLLLYEYFLSIQIGDSKRKFRSVIQHTIFAAIFNSSSTW